MSSDNSAIFTALVPDSTLSCLLDVSRRRLLRTGSIASVGLPLSGAMRGAGPGAQRAQAATRATPARRPVPGNRPTPKVGSGSSFVQPTPYSLQASTELSEDYFLTSAVVVTAQDRVMPFLSDTGQVEAIILASGKLGHLRRDPSASSGWAYALISTQFPTVVDAAVAGGSDGRVSLLVVGPSAGNVTNAEFFEQSGASWSGLGQAQLPGLVGPVHMGVAADGTTYWYTCTHVVVGSYDSFQFLVGGGPFALTAPERVLMINYPVSDAITVQNAVVAYNSNWTGNPDHGAIVVLTSDGVVSIYDQASADAFDQNAGSTASASTLIWAGISTVPSQVNPDWVYQDSTGAVNFFGVSGISALDATYGQGVGDGRVAIWVDNGLYSFVFLDDDSQANVISQYGDATDAQFTDSIPLLTGLDRIYSLPSDPTQATLFAVGLDETLNVMTKSPTTGWTQVPVHQDVPTVSEVPSWRVQIFVLDANGIGVGLGQVQITTDRPVGVWQPATAAATNAGNTVLTPAQAVTMTAGPTGKVSFSIPASDMDTAQLTVQALDAKGAATGDSFAVTPDIDVHNYLAGNGSLPDLGAISAQDLLAAKKADGTALMPLLTSLPAADQDAGATAVLGAFAHLISIAQGTAPGPNDPKSALIDLTGPVPTFSTSLSATGLVRLGTVGSFSSWWDSAKNDTESAFHGIRKGAVEFKHLLTTFGDDAGKWTHDLGVDIGDGVDNLVSYVVTDARTAWHAISGFFHALGADVANFVSWVKHKVLALLQEAAANAKVIEGWLDQAAGTPTVPGELTAMINKIEKWEQGYFTALEARAHREIAALATDFEDLTFGSAAPLPPPSTGSGSGAGTAIKDAQDIMKILSMDPGLWLLDKIESYLPAGDKGPDPIASFAQVIEDIATVFADVVNFSDDAINLVYATSQDLFKDKASFTATKFSTLFGDLDQTVHDAIQVLEAIANTVLDALKDAVAQLADLLSYEFELIPFLGQLFELAGIDTTMSVKHLISLITMYPTTFVHGLMSSDPLFPATTDQADHSGRLGSAADPWALGLGLSACVVQMIWGFNDEVVDGSKSNGTAAPWFCDYIDIMAPIILTVLQWPSDPDSNGKTVAPFAGPFPTGNEAQLLPLVILTGLTPPLISIVFKLVGDPDSQPTDKDSFAGYYMPFILMLSGLANTVLSSVYAWGTGADGNVKAEGILGNLSYVLAPFGTPWMSDSTDKGSLLFLLIVDALANLSAAICMADDAAAAIDG